MLIMKRLNELHKRLINLNIEKSVSDALKLHEKELKEANQRQLSEGIKTDEQVISGKCYSVYWGGVRQRDGKQIGYVDVKFTGAFYKSINVDVTLKETKFSSNIDYASNLSDMYDKQGGTLLGLTNKNVELIAKEFIIPDLLISVKQQLFK